MKLFVLIVILFVTLKENDSYRACKKVNPAENLDSEWYFSAAQKGFHVITTSECQNCEKEDKAWTWLKQRTTPSKYCFRLHGITPDGYFIVDGFCEFANPERPSGNCLLDFTKYETKISMKGTATIFLTDNQNYAVANFCVFGKENLWYLLSTTPKMDPKLKKEVINKIVEQGFDGTEAVEGVSPVVFKNTTLIECK